MKPFLIGFIALGILLVGFLAIFQPLNTPTTGKVVKGLKENIIYTIEINENGFYPYLIYTKLGDKVIFINKSPYPQTITSETIGSGLIMPGENYTIVITQNKSINYFSLINESFKGEIIVLD